MNVEDLSAQDLELNIMLQNSLKRWKPDATIGDLRAAMADERSLLHAYLRARDRKEIKEVLANIAEQPAVHPLADKGWALEQIEAAATVDDLKDVLRWIVQELS